MNSYTLTDAGRVTMTSYSATLGDAHPAQGSSRAAPPTDTNSPRIRARRKPQTHSRATHEGVAGHTWGRHGSDDSVRSERSWYWARVPRGHGEEPATHGRLRTAAVSVPRHPVAETCRRTHWRRWSERRCSIVNIAGRPARLCLQRHATSANQDDRRRVMGCGHARGRHRGPRVLATPSGGRRSWSPSPSRAPAVVERARSNDDRNHRRGPTGALNGCYTIPCFLTAALSGLPHQIRDCSPLLRFVTGTPLEPVIRFTRIP